MIQGYYTPNGRPFIVAEITMQRLGIIDEPIHFLLDTGSDQTVIMPLDGLWVLFIDYRILRPSQSRSTGILGSVIDFEEQAKIVFPGQSGLFYVYDIPVGIRRPHPDIATAPSLLGRDIFDDWNIRYNRSAGMLEADVLTTQGTRTP